MESVVDGEVAEKYLYRSDRENDHKPVSVILQKIKKLNAYPDFAPRYD